VVSGDPNITPIFSRSWLMKMQMVLDLLRLEVSLRSACDMSRACKADVGVAHVSLELGPRGECGHRVDHHHVERPERISMSVISRACSPVSGWEMSSSSMSTPMALA